MTDLKKTKGNPAVAVPAEAPKRELPRVTFTADDIPEIKNWKIGGKYYLELEVEQVAAEKNRYGYEEEKKQALTATFKVIAVKSVNKTEKKKDEDGDAFSKKGYRGNPNII